MHILAEDARRVRRRADRLGFGHLSAEPEVVEDLLDDSGILDGRNQAQSLAASETIKNFYGEGPVPWSRFCSPFA